METIKIDGKPYALATSWDDISFRKFIALMKATATETILSIMLDIPAETIRRAKIKGLENILKKLAFLRSEPLLDDTPKQLSVPTGDAGFRGITFPQDITFETVEQFEDTKTELTRVQSLNDITEQTKSLAVYAAIYIQPKINGGVYDATAALELSEKLFDSPCMEVMSAGSFFHDKCLSIQTGLSMNFLRRNIPTKKNRRGLKKLMRLLGSMLHLTR